MADYNVNMKQWNGTSFDNVLPLAYNAKQLGGQSLAEVKQWVQDNNLLLYTGQYVGTGKFGGSNPTSITFPFEPLIFLTPIDSSRSHSVGLVTFLTQILGTSYTDAYFGVNGKIHAKKDVDGKTITWYSGDGAYNQLNERGIIYYFAAIGGHDMGGETEWTITSSGTWTVPRTGRYMLELYGGGGGGIYEYGSNGRSTRALGGSSCQHYDSVSLTVGASMSVIIGSGGVATKTDATATSFGNYSVAGAGNAPRKDKGGSAAGNYGTAGVSNFATETGEKNPSTGTLGHIYGYGGDGSVYTQGGPGAVYLKYLGA